MNAPSGRSAVRAANGHAATVASAWIGPNASSTMPSHSAAGRQTSNRIPIRRLQSLLHSSSSWSRAPKTRLEHREEGAGAPTYRQMALACAHGADENRRRCAEGAGFVRLTGKRTTAASRPVRIGDVVTLALDRTVRVVRVEGFCERRGSPPTTRALYRDLT